MSAKPVTTFSARTVVLPIDNIDTDQIIPARFLKGTSQAGLGSHLFADWRTDGSGQPKPDFVLNKPEARGAELLVAGDNFGCGSSREHAPWALVDYGFRAIVSTSIADIFRANAIKNGLVPIVVEPALHEKLLAEPGMAITVSVENLTITLPDGTQALFPLDPFAQHCLVGGIDELDFLLAHKDAIAAYETSRQG
jgi:3-isopropylmalate/(R)-2-methylmalate dehydratase small subunit